MVAKFIKALLLANKTTQDWFYAQQLPRGLFHECSAEIKWIFDYRDSKGQYPSLSAFRLRFPKTTLPKVGKDTLEMCLQPVTDRNVFNAMSEAIVAARSMYQGGEEVGKVLGGLRSKLADIQDFSVTSVDLRFGKSTSPMDAYRKRVQSINRGDKWFVPSPWAPLNDLIAFSEPGEHNIIASRTSIGKTWLMLDWVRHFEMANERVLVISKEMSTAQMANRYEALRFKLDYPLFRKGQLRPRDLRRWRDARRSFQCDNVIFSGTETLTGVGFNHIIAKIQEYAPTVVFVDGAYLITPEGLSRNANGVERFTAISNTMKRLCLAFRLRGFSIIQIKREAESKNGDTKPSLKEIYGADSWAQDADNVILIGGKRGSKHRLVSLAKGRESNVGEFNINFQLTPYPDFSASRGLITSGDKVSFTAASF
jgi:replicative DNA helicase